MNAHRLTRARNWILAVLALLLIGGHGFVLYHFSSHLLLSGAAVAGLIIVIVIKHLGLLSALYRPRRRRFDV